DGLDILEPQRAAIDSNHAGFCGEAGVRVNSTEACSGWRWGGRSRMRSSEPDAELGCGARMRSSDAEPGCGARSSEHGCGARMRSPDAAECGAGRATPSASPSASEIRDPRSVLRDPCSEIRDPWLRDPCSEIRAPRSVLRDPRSE